MGTSQIPAPLGGKLRMRSPLSLSRKGLWWPAGCAMPTQAAGSMGRQGNVPELNHPWLPPKPHCTTIPYKQVLVSEKCQMRTLPNSRSLQQPTRHHLQQPPTHCGPQNTNGQTLRPSAWWDCWFAYISMASTSLSWLPEFRLL